MSRRATDRSAVAATLSPAEAADYLGRSGATWYRHVHPHVVRGDILSLPIGRQRRIITSSLDAWCATQARKGWQ